MLFNTISLRCFRTYVVFGDINWPFFESGNLSEIVYEVGR